MAATFKQEWEPFSESWALSLTYFPQIHGGSFLTSSSEGALALFDFSSATPSPAPNSINRRAHSSCINAVEKVDEFTVASAAADGIRVWDLRQSLNRAQVHLSNSKKSPFLSLGSSKGHLLAGGTELSGADAELLLWDLKNPSQIVRSFVDSHHDDITAIEFHPTLPYLMSGSTDGYVNVYNLEEPDEEEALHQVINFASVHSCHFVKHNRISILSHMETLGFWELNNTNYEQDEEPKPNEIGDVRAVLADCEYVVDVKRAGYVAYGANSKQSLTIVPFDAETETFLPDSAVVLSPAHGDEVVRDVLCIPGTNSVLTCGEDGFVKAWELPSAISGAKNEDVSLSKLSIIEKNERKEEKERRKKEKKEKREKKKEKKDKKEKGDARFKPY